VEARVGRRMQNHNIALCVASETGNELDYVNTEFRIDLTFHMPLK
jgi:hypothetical protein